MPNDIDINQLVINKLTKAQYDDLKSKGQVKSDQMYLVKDSWTNAIDVIYNNSVSHLTSTNIQNAIDELANNNNTITANLNNKIGIDKQNFDILQKNQARKNIEAASYTIIKEW